MSHLVRAALQALQLKGNFFGESVVAAGVSFCFFDGTWPLLCDMRKAGTRFCRDTAMGIRRRWGGGGGGVPRFVWHPCSIMTGACALEMQQEELKVDGHLHFR